MMEDSDAGIDEAIASHPLEKMKLDGNHCFLCGDPPGDNQSKEHIFPKWLQRKYNLYNRKLILFNEAEIFYRSLTIPCCSQCNGTYLSQLEKEVRQAIYSGYEATKLLDPTLIFLWVSKIVYAIKFKELFLRAQLSDPDSDNIFNEEYVQGANALHAMMQGVIRGLKLLHNNPIFSVLVLNLHEIEKEPFGFMDDIYSHVVSMHIGEVGIIVGLQDFGFLHQTYGKNYVEVVNGKKLHSIQFSELFAKCVYQSHRIENVPLYEFHTKIDDPKSPIGVRVVNSPIIRDWNQNEYYGVLSSIFASLHPTVELEFVPPDRVTTFMEDENKEPLLLENIEDENT
jgi:hypothetical protein